MSRFIVDHWTHEHKKTLNALNRLKGTTATFNGTYREDPNCCQLLVETDKTEEELDHWLWSRKGIGEYIGVVPTEQQQ